MTNITHILDRDINEIIASNKAANAAAKAEAKRQADAWAVLPPTEKARWGGRPDAWTTADETYED